VSPETKLVAAAAQKLRVARMFDERGARSTARELCEEVATSPTAGTQAIEARVMLAGFFRASGDGSSGIRMLHEALLQAMGQSGESGGGSEDPERKALFFDEGAAKSSRREQKERIGSPLCFRCAVALGEEIARAERAGCDAEALAICEVMAAAHAPQD